MNHPTGLPPRIVAVTLGDPRGIGPEVMCKAVRALRPSFPQVSFLLVGPAGFAPTDLPFHPVGEWDGTQRGAGWVTVEAIRVAVALAASGRLAALVTGPAHKPALHEAGFDTPGQTELLQSLTGAPEVGMLMCAETTILGPPLRVLLATTHLPLRRVFQVLSQDLVGRQTRLLLASLVRDWRLAAPRVGLCAVNPHAGDEGLFGWEDAQILGPVVTRLKEEGWRVEGPLSADTVFHRALRGEFDAVVAPYHDLGIAPFKTVAFGRGVNVTLGLPFPRTSPDHGTAFPLAGTGRADPSSALEAIRLAVFLAENRAEASLHPTSVSHPGGSVPEIGGAV